MRILFIGNDTRTSVVIMIQEANRK